MTLQDAPYSAARRHGELLFVSGQLGVDAIGRFGEGISAQVRLALANLDAVLAAHGSRRSDVVKCQVFLSTMDDWPAMNQIYREHFVEPYPARTAIGVELAPNALVEIDAIAGLRT